MLGNIFLDKPAFGLDNVRTLLSFDSIIAVTDIDRIADWNCFFQDMVASLAN